MQDEIKNELKVYETVLSSVRRKLISADDSRVSSKAIGWVGGLILGAIVASVLGADVQNVYLKLKRLRPKLGDF